MGGTFSCGSVRTISSGKLAPQYARGMTDGSACVLHAPVDRKISRQPKGEQAVGVWS